MIVTDKTKSDYRIELLMEIIRLTDNIVKNTRLELCNDYSVASIIIKDKDKLEILKREYYSL